MKVSRYNIYYKNFVFNTRQRSQLSLPTHITTALKNGNTDNFPQKLLRILSTTGIIVDEEIDERKLFRLWLHTYQTSSQVVSIAYLPTYECNCRCVYCYEDGVRKKYIDTSDFSIEVANHLVEWIKAIVHQVRPLYLDFAFHGGEPLLIKDCLLDIASKIYSVVEQENIIPIFSIVTNGTLLTWDFVREIRKYGFRRALVTLDGLPSYHDRRRPFITGEGTFYTILKNIKNAFKEGLEIVLGFNFDKQNYHHIPQFLDFVVKEALNEYPGFYMIFGAVRRGLTPSNKQYFDLYEVTKKEAAEITAWAYEECLKRGIRIVDPLGMGLCTMKRVWTFTVDPYGKIFKCVTMVRHSTSFVGTIFEPIELIIQRISTIIETQAWQELQACQECKYLPMCLNGCNEQALVKNAKTDCMKEYYNVFIPRAMELRAQRLRQFPDLIGRLRERSDALLHSYL